MPEPLLIDALGPQGDGIHRSARGPVFVDRALPGEHVEATVHKGAGGMLRADVTRLIAASPDRTEPPCRHYAVCGGCTLQHADAVFYRTWKTEIVRDALHKQGLQPQTWHAPMFLPDSKRRRVTFAAFKKKNAVTLGYFRRRTHLVTEITECLVAEPAIMALRARLGRALVPILQDGKTADIFIQVIDGRSEVVITGPVGRKGVPDLPLHEAFADLLHSLNIDRISWRGQDRHRPEIMLERNPLRARFGALDVALPPLAFLQPTKGGEDALVAAVMACLPKAGTFADLFSGCGTFTGPMLTRGAVDAYESDAEAVRALEKAKGAKALKATQRDLFREPLQSDELDRCDAVVFDPPRAGAQAQAAALAQSAVPQLVAVSCNPATFARDARSLVDGGYRLDTVQLIDQFAWSHHVELVAAFSK